MGTIFGQITLTLYYIGGSQRAYFVLQGTFSDVWGHFWLSCWGMGNATGIYWLESRDTAKHHTMHRTASAPTVKNYLDQAVNGAAVKEALHQPHARLSILPAAAQKLSRKRISGSGICLTRKAKAIRWSREDPQVSTPRLHPSSPPCSHGRSKYGSNPFLNLISQLWLCYLSKPWAIWKYLLSHQSPFGNFQANRTQNCSWLFWTRQGRGTERKQLMVQGGQSGLCCHRP